MKKILAILLCAVMALSLVACGEQKTEMQDTNSGTISESEESNKTNDNDIMGDKEIANSLGSELEENNKTVSDDNPLIGTWVCQTNDSLIYMFVNDMDLEIFDAGETFMYAYECDGEWLTITDGDMSRSTSIGISEDGFTLYGDEILAFKNINDSNSESDDEADVGTEGEIVAEFSKFVGTWEEDSNFTHRDRITFFDDGTIKREHTGSEGADLGTNARFDEDYIKWEWTSGELSGFGCAFGPITDFDGNSFIIPAANAYEEAMRYIKIQ